ncbi:UNVERIFIED_ORG: hypothetical protein J3D59_005110 [Pseudomonas fluorescens]|jgi:hypothetical protein
MKKLVLFQVLTEATQRWPVLWPVQQPEDGLGLPVAYRALSLVQLEAPW